MIQFLIPLLLCLTQQAEPETGVALPSGHVVWLKGDWTRRAELWPDTALVFREDQKDLFVLDGGASTPRLVWDYPHRSWSRMSGPTWSADDKVFWCWLDYLEQLVAIDAVTGARRSLTKLPTHSWNYKGDQHLVEEPVWRCAGLVEDASASRLFLLLDAEFNDEMAFWQRGEEQGGTSLVALDSRDGAVRVLAPKSALPPTILSWDLSLSRSRLYLVSKGRTKARPNEPLALEERRLDGTVVRSFAEPDGKAGDILLSPDEKWLLVEREYRIGTTLPASELMAYSREELTALLDASDGGFVLIDLDSGETSDGPESGTNATWAPDSRRVAYADAWDVRLHDLDTGISKLVLRGGPKHPDGGSATWVEVIWAPGADRLALATWSANYALLLDLAQHEYFVLGMDASHLCWSPVPKPFAGP